VRAHFGTQLDWPSRESIESIVDERHQRIVENSDGLAHVLYLVFEIEKHDQPTTFLLEEPVLGRWTEASARGSPRGNP